MNPVCPENCAYDIPGVSYNVCAPQVKNSQVRRLFIAKANAADFEDWTQDTEWIARVSQNNTEGNDYIRAITCTGDMPAPSSTKKVIDNGIELQITKARVINFTTFQLTDDNYNFMRGSECGTLVKLMGLETMGGAFYGGNKGQLVSLNMDIILAGGEDDIENLTGSLSWKNKFSLERISESPIFDIEFNLPGEGVLFDTVMLFADTVERNEEGVNVTVTAEDADLKFEFNKINAKVGAPTNMLLKLAGVTVASIDFPADYLGAAFRFTDAAAVVHTGIFAAGDVVLV